MSSVRLPLITAALLALSAAHLAGQITGLPVRNTLVHQGFTLGVEVGAANRDYGDGRALGLRPSLGIGPFGLSALVTRYDVADPFPNQTGYGLAASYRIRGGQPGSVAATLQAAGELFWLDGMEKWHFPLGLGLSVPITGSAVTFTPWVAPRLDLFRNGFDASPSTEVHFGVSGGLDVGLPVGLTALVAVDRTFAGDGFSPTVFSAGLQYHFRAPR